MTLDLDFRIIGRAGRDLHARLDGMAYPDVVEELGQPDRIATVFGESPWWSPGDMRPALTTDDPATAQAMARCLASRTRGPIPPGILAEVVATGAHRMAHPEPPDECGWCPYSEAQLRPAVGHAAYLSRLIISEVATWRGLYGSHYQRGTPRQDTYDNPRWRDWFAQEPDRRTANDRRRQEISAAAAP